MTPLFQQLVSKELTNFHCLKTFCSGIRTLPLKPLLPRSIVPSAFMNDAGLQPMKYASHTRIPSECSARSTQVTERNNINFCKIYKHLHLGIKINSVSLHPCFARGITFYLLNFPIELAPRPRELMSDFYNQGVCTYKCRFSIWL